MVFSEFESVLHAQSHNRASADSINQMGHDLVTMYIRHLGF